MDFERVSIKALFYDYPVEAVVKAIKDVRRNKDGYLDILPQLVRWREDAFTTTEARLMENIAHDIWMKSEVQDIPFIYRPFLLVQYMADVMLEQDAVTLEPRVRFDELFRWKDTTLFLGEDLLTTAFIANIDSKKLSKTDQVSVFDWPDYIPNGNADLNAVLDKGVVDVHSHYNASADVFQLNWIDLMNSLSNIEEHLKKVQEYQDVTLSTVGTEQLYPLRRMCIAAAYLRVQFFKMFNYQQDGELCCVERILEDDIYADMMKSELRSEISALRTFGLRGRNGRTIDYAIVPDMDICNHLNNAHLISHGERKLMYQFFYRFFLYDRKAWISAPYFYLYTILKTRVRKEFVQINQLKGFENFETYQDRKDLFIEENDPIAEIFDSMVLQTTVRQRHNDHLEARVTPSELKRMVNNSRLVAKNYAQGIFTNKAVVSAQRLSLVVHFIKANYTKAGKAKDLRKNNRQDYARYAKYRKELKEYIDLVLKRYHSQKASDIQVVGIDAASTEMFCRPEVFGHIFRFARKKGLCNQTYHVGEDFFDIVDGLRAIDEAILFLDLQSGNRIGHGLAMGIDAKDYYERRHLRILAPKQYVLDNCVWICKTASKNDIDIPNSLETQLRGMAKRLYEGIGYDKQSGKQFDMDTYWDSILLRGDEPNRFDKDDEEPQTEWQQTAQLNNGEVNVARENKDAKKLYELYHFDHDIKENGEVRYQDKYLPSIVDVVEKLQEVMCRKVCAKQIAVECNPTSNLKIGFIDNYCEHPLLTKFDPIDKQTDVNYPLLSASVSTDDRGVFATTVYNELSLLALSLKKQKNKKGQYKYGTRQIMEYIEHLRQAGVKQQFEV